MNIMFSLACFIICSLLFPPSISYKLIPVINTMLLLLC